MRLRPLAFLFALLLIAPTTIVSAGGRPASNGRGGLPPGGPPLPVHAAPVPHPVRTVVKVRQGSLLGGVQKPTSVVVTGGIGLHFPTGIYVTTTGNVWVADSGNSRLVKFSPNGAFAGTCGSYGSGAGQFGSGSPTSVAVDAKFNIYATDPGNTRLIGFNYKCQQTHAAYMRRGSGESIPGPWYVDVDNYYNVYFTTNQVASSPSVWRMRSNWSTFDGFGKSSSWNGVYGIAWTSAPGYAYDMYVSSASNWVRRLSPGGTLLGQFGSNLRLPRGESFAPNGYLYVADTANNRISWFTAAGQYVGSFGSFGSGIGQYNYPSDVSIDSLGNIYIADEGNNRVVKTSPNGTVLAIWQ